MKKKPVNPVEEIQNILTGPAHSVEKVIDSLMYRLRVKFGTFQPIKIIPYRGYGMPSRLYIKGRVLEDPHVSLSQKTDRTWDNLRKMYRRMESNEIPGAVIKARIRGMEKVVRADEEGYFEAWFEFEEPLVTSGSWEPVEIELVEPLSKRQAEPPRASGEILVPPATARYAVISDVDDTVVYTDATHPLQMFRNVFLGSARTRLPFVGAAELYRAFHAGPRGSAANPLFFVSSSPWNLYDLLMDFFQLQGIPNPVLILRDWGLTENEFLPFDNREHKRAIIQQILDSIPHLPFILVGDSGQQDPEIYADIVAAYPRRVLAVYIRDAGQGQARAEAVREMARQVSEQGCPMLLANDSQAMAQHACDNGWIAPGAYPGIRAGQE